MKVLYDIESEGHLMSPGNAMYAAQQRMFVTRGLLRNENDRHESKALFNTQRMLRLCWHRPSS